MICVGHLNQKKKVGKKVIDEMHFGQINVDIWINNNMYVFLYTTYL